MNPEIASTTPPAALSRNLAPGRLLSPYSLPTPRKRKKNAKKKKHTAKKKSAQRKQPLAPAVTKSLPLPLQACHYYYAPCPCQRTWKFKKFRYLGRGTLGYLFNRLIPARVPGPVLHHCSDKWVGYPDWESQIRQKFATPRQPRPLSFAMSWFWSIFWKYAQNKITRRKKYYAESGNHAKLWKRELAK